MNEKYLHFLWKQKRLTTVDLRTTKGEKLTIKNFGNYNTDSGPDFSNGSILLNGIVLHGNIEMHINSSDWIKHGHQNDPAYNNVILHVVYNHDQEVVVNGNDLPVLELKSMIDWNHYKKMGSKLKFQQQIPCETQIYEIHPETVLKQLKLNTHQRLKRKSEEIDKLDKLSQSSMMELLFRLMLNVFGGKLNGLPFTELAFRVPVVSFLRSSTRTREAILFGLAGFLDEIPCDDYFAQLQADWNFHKHRLNISSISQGSLKFKGTRPAGFPTLRLAQFAAFSGAFDWSTTFWLSEPEEIIEYFVSALRQKPHPYWETHYHFGKRKLKSNTGVLSLETTHVIIINAIAPFLFWYGQKTSNVILLNKAIELLELIPLEKNARINHWNKLVYIEKNARFGQAVLELEQHLCHEKKCLDCLIGKELLFL